MNLNVLIPTHGKTKEELIEMIKSYNLHTDAIIANQNGFDETYFINYNNHIIKIICSNTIGVSKNRNILLENAEAEINLFIDDDCSLVDNYNDIILSFFKETGCDCAVFNGFWITKNNRLVHYKKTKKLKHFYQISYAGGPGFAFKKKSIKNYDLHFNEKLGYPNYICAGEDSFFYYNLVKRCKNAYRVATPVFKVEADTTNSCYYSGINKQYIETRGFILKAIYPKTYFLFFLKHAIRFKKIEKKISIFKIIKYLCSGSKLTY